MFCEKMIAITILMMMLWFDCLMMISNHKQIQIGTAKPHRLFFHVRWNISPSPLHAKIRSTSDQALNPQITTACENALQHSCWFGHVVWEPHPRAQAKHRILTAGKTRRLCSPPGGSKFHDLMFQHLTNGVHTEPSRLRDFQSFENTQWSQSNRIHGSPCN